MKKVSVITPCYNDGQYLNDAIRSVREQTYPNIEIVVIDDGSDDPETLNVLDALPSDIVVLHTQHARPAGARNYGIANCTGTYILPLDADDQIEPTYIEKAVAVLDQNPSCGIVYCEADLFGEKHGKWDLPEYSFENFLLDNIIFVTSLFRKSDWEQVGGFNTNMKAGMEDYDFWLSILALGRTVHQFPETLFHYRIKKDSRTSNFQSNYLEIQKTYRTIYENHHDFYIKNMDAYANVLRDALIKQIALRTEYEMQLKRVLELRKIPILGKLIQKAFQV